MCQSGQAICTTDIRRSHLRAPRDSMWFVNNTLGANDCNYELLGHGRTKPGGVRAVVARRDPTMQHTQSRSSVINSAHPMKQMTGRFLILPIAGNKKANMAQTVQKRPRCCWANS